MRRIRHVGRYSKEDREIGGKLVWIYLILFILILGLGSPRVHERIITIIVIVVYIVYKVYKSCNTAITKFNSIGESQEIKEDKN